jgi:hypothetical protein
MLTSNNVNVVISEEQQGVCEIQTITVACDVNFVREVQEVQLAGGQAVTVSFNGQPAYSTTLSSTASTAATQLEQAIESFYDSNGNQVLVDVTVVNTTYSVRFISPVGDVPTLEIEENSVSVDVLESVKGVSPIQGTYTILFEGQYTDDLAFDASAADVKSALESLSTVNIVGVYREDMGNGFKWTVSFTQNVGNLRMMEASDYVYEIQEISTTGGAPTPLHGEFTITYSDESINVNYDISADELAAALESMASVGHVEVSREVYTNGQFTWFITFRSLIGDIDNMGFDDQLLLGSNGLFGI